MVNWPGGKNNKGVPLLHPDCHIAGVAPADSQTKERTD